MIARSSGPLFVNSLTEMPRVMMEAGLLTLSWPSLLAYSKKGSGQPVIVIPGFLGGDDSTLALRRFLTMLGYPAQPWLLGRNKGRPDAVKKLGRRFYRLFQVYGKPITLIGQSLGGVYARELARQFPEAVRLVVTLGSPFGVRGTDDTSPIVSRLFESMSGMTVDEMRAQMTDQDPTKAPPVPSTAIFSKSDGVVAWRACVQEETKMAENIEVIGSHTGMAMHPQVWHIIADRLAQDPNDWQKYKAPAGCKR